MGNAPTRPPQQPQSNGATFGMMQINAANLSAALAAKLQPQLNRLRAQASGLLHKAQQQIQRLSPAQRILGASVVAIVLVASVAALSLSGPLSAPTPNHKVVSVAAPSLPTRVTLTAPQRPSLNMPEAATPTAETAPPMSIPLAEQLRILQNTPVTLGPAPIEDLTVATPQGRLPKIGTDGRLPWQAYARPAPVIPPGTPRLAVLLIDMGLSERLTIPALEQLPGQVTVALNGNSPKLADYLSNARARGHEVLLDIPAEPRFYPEEDPGPTALMTRIGNEENIKRLRTWLAQAPGALGILSTSGTQYVTDASAMTPVVNELGLRGLAWLDTGDKSIGSKLANQTQVATATVNIDLDRTLTPSAIKKQFESALAFARTNESVLIVARPYPLTVSLLIELLGTLPDAGVALVPASALLTAATPAAAPTTKATHDDGHQ